MCNTLSARPKTVANLPEEEREYLRYAVMERMNRRNDAMPNL
jgi:hypothetical protein